MTTTMETFNLQSLLLLFLAVLNVTGIYGLSGFEDYHAASFSLAPIKLNDTSFEKLTSTPRDYTAIVLLTARDTRFGCQLCRDFEPEWDLIGKSWIKGDKKWATRVLYATLDFPDGKETFQKVIHALEPHDYRSNSSNLS
jgi:oligosaccharyltransferase complex subunit gamma